MTFSDPNPGFKVTVFFEGEYRPPTPLRHQMIIPARLPCPHYPAYSLRAVREPPAVGLSNGRTDTLFISSTNVVRSTGPDSPGGTAVC